MNANLQEIQAFLWQAPLHHWNEPDIPSMHFVVHLNTYLPWEVHAMPICISASLNRTWYLHYLPWPAHLNRLIICIFTPQDAHFRRTPVNIDDFSQCRKALFFDYIFLGTGTNTPFQQDAFQDTLKWLMILKYHFSQAGYHHQWQLSSSSWWWWFSGESCASSILPPTPLSHLSCVPAHISQVRWSDYDDKLMIW